MQRSGQERHALRQEKDIFMVACVNGHKLRKNLCFLRPLSQRRALSEENDRVMRAVRRFPNRAYGSVYLSPSYLDFSLEEFDRCVRDGPMVSVGELEADKRCNAPELDPIVEQAVSMKAPILQHTWLKVGGNEPGESTPYDLVELAERHPQATFICAHTGGDRKSTRLNSSHGYISYAVFCLKKKKMLHYVLSLTEARLFERPDSVGGRSQLGRNVEATQCSRVTAGIISHGSSAISALLLCIH